MPLMFGLLYVFTLLCGGLSQPSPSLLNSYYALQAQQSFIQVPYLLLSCSIFPFSTMPDCRRIVPPLRGFTSDDFVQGGYTSRHYDAIMWLVTGMQTRSGVLGSMASTQVVNGTVYGLCETYSYGQVNTIADLLNVAQLVSGYSYRSMVDAITAFTDRSLLQAFASLASAQFSADAMINVLNTQPIISSVSYGVSMSFNQSRTIFSSFQTNCSALASMKPYTIRPLGRARTIDGKTSFTGPLAAQSGKQYTNANLAQDLTTLNFMLTMHRLHAAIFAEAARTFNSFSYLMFGFDPSVAEGMAQIAFNEQLHVNTLTTLIAQLAGNSSSAAPTCSYGFAAAMPVSMAFISTAKQMMTAYMGVAISLNNAVVSTDIQRILGSILNAESRQFTYLTMLLTGWPGRGVQNGPGHIGMGMEAVPVMQSVSPPDSWRQRIPGSISYGCVDVPVPTAAPSEEFEQDEVPDENVTPSSTGPSNQTSTSSTGTSVGDKPNAAASLSTSTVVALSCLFLSLMFV